MPEVFTITDPSGPRISAGVARGVRQPGDGGDRQAPAAIGGDWSQPPASPAGPVPGQLAAGLASEVRFSDLFVGTRPYGDLARQHRVEEAVLFESVRPCLFVPPGHRAPASYSTVVVAWKNTRESAVAVAADTAARRRCAGGDRRGDGERTAGGRARRGYRTLSEPPRRAQRNPPGQRLEQRVGGNPQ